jgi:WXXGXW repeat (2 copies)
MYRRFLALVALLGCFAATSLGASAQSYGGPRYAPPPAHYEHHGAPPGSGYVWVGGYHRWNGHQYVWTGGTWQRPPHYGYRWYAGSWQPRNGVYVYISGHWGPP